MERTFRNRASSFPTAKLEPEIAIVTDKPGPIASYAAGQIAIQTLLSVIINLHIARYEDPDKAREEIISTAEEIIDKAAIPDLPAGEQKQARDQAKFVLGVLINGGDVH
jgi:hypothetical protein